MNEKRRKDDQDKPAMNTKLQGARRRWEARRAKKREQRRGRVCRGCGQRKPRGEFHDNPLGDDILAMFCKDCLGRAYQEWVEEQQTDE